MPALHEVVVRPVVTEKSSAAYQTRKETPVPQPDVEGGGGRKDEWKWSTMRPWLEKTFKRDLSFVNPKNVPL